MVQTNFVLFPGNFFIGGMTERLMGGHRLRFIAQRRCHETSILIAESVSYNGTNNILYILSIVSQ